MDVIEREGQLAIGHYLTLRRPPQYGSDLGIDFGGGDDGWAELRFQNFWIGENAIWQDGSTPKVHTFAPFGFSGISVNRSGDNVDTALIFPNYELTRAFADTAVQEEWSAVVRVCWITNLTDSQTSPTMLHHYSGRVSSAQWKDTEITLRLNSVLDAVTAQVPARTLHQLLVGNVPISGQVSL